MSARFSSSRWLKAGAKTMRAEMTPQEKAIWHLLHDGELVALHWRRQAAFGQYVLDFVSHAAKLILEIDGAQHAGKSQVKHYAQKSAWLNSQGYRVLRVWNVEAVREKEGVWRAIHGAACETRAVARMQRWRAEKMRLVRETTANITSPSMGEVAAQRPEGVTRADGEDEASVGLTGNASGPYPLSHAARDSSPAPRSQSDLGIEGRRLRSSRWEGERR